MIKTSKIALSVLAAGAVALALVPAVQAVPITGTVQMAGKVSLDSTALGSTTKTTGFGLSFVTSGTDSYAGTEFSIVTFKNFTFGATGAQVVPDLWKFVSGGALYEFNLASITSIAHAGNNDLLLKGLGSVAITGLDTTPANWSFDVTDTSNGSGSFTFGFSQSDTATGVPEAGTTVILLGLGLIALASFGQFRKHGIA